MNTRHDRPGRRPQLTPLAACLAAALAAAHAPLHARLVAAPPARATAAIAAAATHPRAMRGAAPPRPASLVTSCEDNGAAGTLRYEIFHAADGDTVDLGELTCSTITLANGAIPVAHDDLTITASPSHPITIDAHGASRIFEHGGFGTGALTLQNLDLLNGYFRRDVSYLPAQGGCVFWPVGALTLLGTRADHCQAINAARYALGGAIYALDLSAERSTVSDSLASGLGAGGGGIFASQAYLRDSVVSDNRAISSGGGPDSRARGGGTYAFRSQHLVRSVIADNLAQSDDGMAEGGGIYQGHGYRGVDLSYSTISGNIADSPASSGGGVRASGSSTIYYSTIDRNEAVNNAALALAGQPGDSVAIRNSTISTNTATTGSSAIFASLPLTIANSTIAFNVAAGSSAGLYLYPGGDANLISTIVAGNTSGAGGGFDLVARASVTGNHDLIENPATSVPVDTIVGVDPLLAPLVDNGGPTMTHALSPASVAIDAGGNAQYLAFDQRGAGFSRVIGAAADIGAYEANPVTDRVFANGFEFD